ncbi:hypothetical protein SAMN05444394_4176 [Algoriphagus halophilus]|uniref:Uncharacterized protein n=1 Tax=Algoriphagus halophilus TaxID=226505 RepID=A0A1N6HZS9_9BACT|nr:hypothetical protein SAMN05444394_4176 [Algoriphagus halophilus]
MKKIVLSLFFIGAVSIANAGCFQAVRKCDGTWTAYNCIADATSSQCSAYYCYSCPGGPPSEQ